MKSGWRARAPPRDPMPCPGGIVCLQGQAGLRPILGQHPGRPGSLLAAAQESKPGSRAAAVIHVT